MQQDPRVVPNYLNAVGLSEYYYVLSERKSKNLNINDYSDKERLILQDKIKAFEQFVNLNTLVLGILQILILSMPDYIWPCFSAGFRT